MSVASETVSAGHPGDGASNSGERPVSALRPAAGTGGGDLAEYLRAGDVVLDIGCGRAGRCLRAAAAVGQQGRVLGVDLDERALATAREGLAQAPAEQAPVRFAQVAAWELREDLESLQAYVRDNPVTDADSLQDFLRWRASRREREPAVASDSVDVAIASDLHQLLPIEHRGRAFGEIARVLKPGGRFVLTDVVSDEPVPDELRADRELVRAGLAQAVTERDLWEAVTGSGLVSPRCSGWGERPRSTYAGIEFREIEVIALKPTGSECLDRGDAVIYRGPYAEITDDEGHVFIRGERMAVCERTFAFLTTGPMAEDFVAVPAVSSWPGVPWCAPPGTRRTPRETKAGPSSSACAPDEGCC